MSFITDDFLLSTEPARKLYHGYAKGQPIYDYHGHLPPADLASNRRFDNLYDAWLAGDHYKWRAMRSSGVEERYCTGEADPWEKFLAFARTVPATLRNPLFHWTHLELLRYFGIDVLLNEHTAGEVWEEANRQLKEMTVKDILDRFKVALVSTTDDPADSLEEHRRVQEANPYDTVVYPAFRPDKACRIADPEAFNAYLDTLSAASGEDCGSFEGLCAAIDRRHAFFHEMGSRLSDHGLTRLPVADCTEAEARAIFGKVRGGAAPSGEEQDKFLIYMMVRFGELDAAAGWTKQMHLGAMRNNNPRAWRELGPDTGFDSIGDYPQAEGLSRYLGKLADADRCPKTILYNLNPADNYLFGTMIGNFQDGRIAGKVQFGSAWWFNDQKEGMEAQINALSNLGLLSRFVGMLTDGRSFLSFPRHEYFRRVLCEVIGGDVARGELPDDEAWLGGVVKDICFNNARDYFGMALNEKYA